MKKPNFVKRPSLLYLSVLSEQMKTSISPLAILKKMVTQQAIEDGHERANKVKYITERIGGL